MSKLLVLSFDALQFEDLELLLSCPYFSQCRSQLAVVERMREIYPTLTYPIHTTLITGVRPDVHGIFHNQRSDIAPKKPDWNLMGSDWYWYKEAIRVETLVDAAHAAGKTVATISWPVTAGDKRGINIPEIWPQPGQRESVSDVYERASSPEAYEQYYSPFIERYNWRSGEDLTRYHPEIALDILERYRPDLMLCHIIALDHIKHLFGIKGFAVTDCLRQLDVYFGRFLQVLERSGVLQETNIVILGDHGQIDIQRHFNLNVLLAEAGLIELDASGSVLSHVAYSFSAGFSTQIIVSNLGEGVLERVYEVLLDIQKRFPEYVERVYTADEVAHLEGLKGDFSFVLEATEGTQFANAVCGQVVIEASDASYAGYKANHGHHPSKGGKPPFLAMGPDVIPGMCQSEGDILNVCPTLAGLLGVELSHALEAPFDMLK